MITPQRRMCTAKNRTYVLLCGHLSSFGTGTMPVHMFYNYSNLDIHFSACCCLFFVCCDFLASTHTNPCFAFSLFEHHLLDLSAFANKLTRTSLVHFFASINHTNQGVLLFHYFSLLRDNFTCTCRHGFSPKSAPKVRHVCCCVPLATCWLCLRAACLLHSSQLRCPCIFSIIFRFWTLISAPPAAFFCLLHVLLFHYFTTITYLIWAHSPTNLRK